MDRSKSLAGIDRDRVARHRNQMHEIALQKQISVIQQESKLIERELREITKVKNTLMQIRSPLKKRVLRSEVQINYRETKRPTRNCQTLKKRHPSKPGKKEQKLNKVDSSLAFDGCEVERSKLKPIAKHDGPNPCRKQLDPAVNLNSSHEQQTDDGKNPQIRKISFAKHEKTSEREMENVEKCLSAGENCGLPPVDVFKSTCNNIRVSKLEANTANTTRSISATPLSKPVSVSVQDRPETSMTVALRKSKLSEQPASVELSRPAASRSRYEQEQEQLTLTMEETLRIKGKFRQIGHSIIATALLKGIKQRGHLTSEAIHNMHKPVMVSDKTVNQEQEKKQEREQEQEGNEDNDDVPVKKGLEKFRKVTRKAMNVNAFVNNGRQKSANQLQRQISKTSDEGNDVEHGKKILLRRKRFAGVGHAVLFARTAKPKIDSTETDNEDRKITKKSLMNLSTQERRKKLSGIAAMTTTPSPRTSPTSELPKPKTVTFRLDNAWE